jgi:hypothetical protein
MKGVGVKGFLVRRRGHRKVGDTLRSLEALRAKPGEQVYTFGVGECAHGVAGVLTTSYSYSTRGTAQTGVQTRILGESPPH